MTDTTDNAPHKMTLHSVDNGFCRVYYNYVNSQGQKLLYCLQDEGENYGGVKCYRCSKDGEPDYTVTPKGVTFEKPTGTTETEKAVLKYLDNMGV